MNDNAVKQSTRQPTGTAALSAAAGVLLAGCILFTGTFLANAVKDVGGELVVQQVFRQEGTRVRGSENKLLRGKTVALLQQYAFAFADAAIRFDTVPKLDSKVFLALATSMPDDIEPTAIAFDEHSVVLSCRAANAESPALFYERLCNEAVFAQVEQSDITPDGDGWRFQVTCVPRVEKGQFNFQPPETSQSTLAPS